MTNYLHRLVKAFIALFIVFAANTSIAQTDFLFIVDNSGSISPSEFAKFENVIEDTGNSLSLDCPNSKYAVVHYGGAFGQEYTIQNDFINWNIVSDVNRVYLDCVTSGTANCGDDLHAAFGSIDSEIGSGLNLTPGSDLIVVIFTDADGTSVFGINMSPCSSAACSTILPTTNFDNFISSIPNASSYVVGIEDTDNAALLANYLHGDGTYIPIDLDDDSQDVAMEISSGIDCALPSIGLAKNLTDLSKNLDGSYTVEFLFTIENFSDVTLSNLNVNDDIVGQFAGYSPSNFDAINGSLIASNTWNGTATSNILASGQTILAGTTETVSVKFDIIPDGVMATLNNTAFAKGNTPSNALLCDKSSEGLNPDPDNDGDPKECDPTKVVLPEYAMIRGEVWKDNSGNGLKETAEPRVDGVKVFLKDCSGTIIGSDDSDVAGNFAFFNVPPGNYLLEFDTSALPPGCDFTIPNAGNDAIDSDVFSTGQTACFPIVGGDDERFDAGLVPVGVIGLSKNLMSLNDNSNGSYDVVFSFVIKSFSNFPINDLVLTDDIVGQFAGLMPSNFSVMSGSLVGNNSWNGTASSNILASGQSIGAGEMKVVTLKFTIVPDGISEYVNNLADVSGTDPSNNTISDVSTDGFEPDPNMDGNPEENEPTKVPLPTTGKIGNFVWHDINGDGIQNGGEHGLSNVTVELRDANSIIYATTVTNSSGNYIFEDVPAGYYYIKFYPPGNFESTFANQGFSSLSDSNIDGSFGSGTTPIIHLFGGECDLSIDAGFYTCVPLGERVWYDFNYNSIDDPIENGINGLRVELWKFNNGTLTLFDYEITGPKPNTFSDDGYYKFCAPPGRYQLRFITPPIGLGSVVENIFGYQNLTSANESSTDSDVDNNAMTDIFTIVSGQEICSISAGFSPMATVGNRVWIDNNADGIQNANENGLGGVSVLVYDMDNTMVDQDVTSGTGEYSINNLITDEYYLKFVLPSQYSFTQPNNGSESMDSDVTGDFGEGTTASYSLSNGDFLDNIDAGVMLALVPLTWLNIDAEARDIHNEVIWETTAEINSSHFEIQVRNNEDDDFRTIGITEAKGENSSVSTYSFNDLNILDANYFMYRIKQVDNDGNYDYSDVVELNRSEENKKNVIVYPNPVTTFFTIEMTGIKNVALNLYDIKGKEIRKIINGQVDSEFSLDVNTKEFSAGTYLLKGMVDGESFSKKIIIQ